MINLGIKNVCDEAMYQVFLNYSLYNIQIIQIKKKENFKNLVMMLESCRELIPKGIKKIIQVKERYELWRFRYKEFFIRNC